MINIINKQQKQPEFYLYTCLDKKQYISTQDTINPNEFISKGDIIIGIKYIDSASSIDEYNMVCFNLTKNKYINFHSGSNVGSIFVKEVDLEINVKEKK